MIPNLEIMKLATYYRQEENTFCRMIDLEEKELGAYEKIFFFSEVSKNIEVPQAFRSADNVIFGGTALTNGIYKPFENEIIDYTIAKPFIYKEILKQRFQAGVKIDRIGHILDDSYYRMRAGDKELPIPPVMLKKRFYIYDRNIFYDNWQDVFQKISDRGPSKIITIHPIYCKTLTDFFAIRNFNRFSRTSEIILDIDIPQSEIPIMLKKYKNKFLADVNKSSNVCLELGGTHKTAYNYYKDFIYKINLLYSFWAHDIPVKIKYVSSKDNNNPIQDLEKDIELWANKSISSQARMTIEERLQGRGKITHEKFSPLREQSDIILKHFPTATGLFKQSYINLIERKIWRV